MIKSKLKQVILQLLFHSFRWEWLEDGKMHELTKKSAKVESMDVEDENENIASLF